MRYAQSQARLFAARKRAHPILFPKEKDRRQAFLSGCYKQRRFKNRMLATVYRKHPVSIQMLLNQKDDERCFRRINSAKALPNKTSVSKTTNRGLATGTAVTTRNRITGDCVVPATLSMATH